MKRWLFLPLFLCVVAYASVLRPDSLSAPEKSPNVIRGKASYYDAHNRRTASGERFHRDSFTCAHRTFPFGTRLKVRDTRTGREVIVRVTDRGPFGNKYILDISIAAARQLGIIRRGYADVEISEYKETCPPLLPGPLKLPKIDFDALQRPVPLVPLKEIAPAPLLKPLKVEKR